MVTGGVGLHCLTMSCCGCGLHESIHQIEVAIAKDAEGVRSSMGSDRQDGIVVFHGAHFASIGRADLA